MRLILLNDAQAVGWWAACHIVERIQAFQPTADRPFVLGLPTGSTPLVTYQGLIEHYQAGRLSFQHVVVFGLDESVGLPPHHPQSHHHFMHLHLFNHVDMRPENIHLLNGMAEDLDQTCQHYEERIRHYGGIHLFVGGVGRDGHIAFNEPASSLASRTRIKTLTGKSRQATPHFFANTLQQLPKQALTIGIGTLLEAEEIMMLITGYHKALALQAAVEGSVNHLWAVSALQLHPKTVLICDEAATQELKVKTVSYFTALEADNLNQWSQGNRLHHSAEQP